MMQITLELRKLQRLKGKKIEAVLQFAIG